MINFVLRISVIMIFTILIISCAPNYKKTSKNHSSTVIAYKFKYGKYCGAGHPKLQSKPGTKNAVEELNKNWPPEDDIDLMCYAHDLCYEAAGSNNLICDQALSALAGSNANSFNRGNGCRNLVRLVGLGLGAKSIGNEENKAGALIISTANLLWTLPLSLSFYAVTYPEKEKYGYPEQEKTCYKNNRNELHVYQMMSDFEAEYREYAKGYEFFSFSKAGEKSVSLPVKIPNWRNTFTIFEIQKYLNYYGYNAGPTVDFWNPQSIRALHKFAHDHNIDSNNIGEIYTALKKFYGSRSFHERATVIKLSPSEKANLYGYTN